MKNYETTERKAINESLRLMRLHTPLKRIKNYLISKTSAQCNCGESSAITISKKINNIWHYEQVIICPSCFKNN